MLLLVPTLSTQPATYFWVHFYFCKWSVWPKVFQQLYNKIITKKKHEKKKPSWMYKGDERFCLQRHNYESTNICGTNMMNSWQQKAVSMQTDIHRKMTAVYCDIWVDVSTVRKWARTVKSNNPDTTNLSAADCRLHPDTQHQAYIDELILVLS